jgi:ribonuclease-3
LGKGEEKNDGRNNKKIGAALFEAVVGAIYLDSNYKVASSIVFSYFRESLEKFEEKASKVNDYKSELQELIQKKYSILPYYRIIDESGKPPNVVFTAAVYLEKKQVAIGTGKNKRNAEQDAAYNALMNIDEFINYEKLSDVFFLKND